MINLSIIIPFLNSHELVRRQIINLKNMDLPEDVEIIYMDDGSNPPLKMPIDPPKNFQIYATNDFRPWTSSLARNTGATIARGSYLFMTDGDYIITKKAVMIALGFCGDRLGCRREFGILDEDGNFTQDHNVLMSYGLPEWRIKERGTKIPPHPNNFIMRASLFKEMGGYREDLILSRPYPQGEDRHFKRLLMKLVNEGKIVINDYKRPTIYMFPNGQFCGDVDYNPFNLFHTLTRKTPQNHWYLNPRYIRGEK